MSTKREPSNFCCCSCHANAKRGWYVLDCSACGCYASDGYEPPPAGYFYVQVAWDGDEPMALPLDSDD